MKCFNLETKQIVEAEQFLGFDVPYEEGGLLEQFVEKSIISIDLANIKCAECGHLLKEHIYVPITEYDMEGRSLCVGDFYVFDEEYKRIKQEKFAKCYKTLQSLCGNGKQSEPCTIDEPEHFTHPLKNPDSSHYAMWHNGDGEAVEAIDLMEKMFTPEELLTWAKITVLKYRLRIGKKDDIAKEMKKIETYEAYVHYLEAMPRMKSTKIDFNTILGGKRG